MMKKLITMPNVAIASDHAGVALKKVLKDAMQAKGYMCDDLGAYSDASVDYPDFGYAVAQKIRQKAVDFGVLICGSGIGISIAANREPTVRAALCHNRMTAELARKHNDANVLVLGARVVSEEQALECLNVFLNTVFEGERHQKRVEKLNKPNL